MPKLSGAFQYFRKDVAKLKNFVQFGSWDCGQKLKSKNLLDVQLHHFLIDPAAAPVGKLS